MTFCIKVGSDESHLNVSVECDGQSHKTVSTNHNLFEEKGEPKRYRTEVRGGCVGGGGGGCSVFVYRIKISLLG